MEIKIELEFSCYAFLWVTVTGGWNLEEMTNLKFFSAEPKFGQGLWFGRKLGFPIGLKCLTGDDHGWSSRP